MFLISQINPYLYIYNKRVYIMWAFLVTILLYLEFGCRVIILKDKSYAQENQAYTVSVLATVYLDIAVLFCKWW